jgi:hypothetical protein
MLGVVILSIVMLGVIILRLVMMIVIMLSVVMFSDSKMSVIMLNVDVVCCHCPVNDGSNQGEKQYKLWLK